MTPLDQLRTLCHSLSNVEERPSHGEPAWFFKGKKLLVMFADHHHDDRVAFWCATPAGAQEAMIASDPSKYFRPPYVGVKGWLGVYLDVEVDWGELEGIIEEAYHCVTKH